MIPAIPVGDLPALSHTQMVEVDRLMIETYGIDLLQMMENAGRELARLTRHLLLSQTLKDQTVVVLAGKGGNGGGGARSRQEASRLWRKSPCGDSRAKGGFFRGCSSSAGEPAEDRSSDS